MIREVEAAQVPPPETRSKEEQKAAWQKYDKAMERGYELEQLAMRAEKRMRAAFRRFDKLRQKYDAQVRRTRVLAKDLPKNGRKK